MKSQQFVWLTFIFALPALTGSAASTVGTNTSSVYDNRQALSPKVLGTSISGAATSLTEATISKLRYGLYIHFDISTFTAYDMKSPRFGKESPDSFNFKTNNIRQWAQVAKQAGMDFALLTAKHEAGFCLWPSKVYDYTVAQSPTKADILAEYVSACKAEGIIPGIHYSVPNAHIEGRVKFGGPVNDSCFSIIKRHIQELVTNYPDIQIYQFCTSTRLTPDQFRKLIELIKRSNPEKIVFQQQLIEEGRPRKISGIPGVPEHTCDTVIRNWFWKPECEIKTASDLYKTYTQSRQEGLPYVLNVGPNRQGCIPNDQIVVLSELKSMITIPDPDATKVESLLVSKESDTAMLRQRNRALISFKALTLPEILREKKTAELTALSVQIEQVILDLNHEAELEKDRAQRALEQNPKAAEERRELAIGYKERIEVLKPIGAAVKEEIANRAK